MALRPFSKELCTQIVTFNFLRFLENCQVKSKYFRLRSSASKGGIERCEIRCDMLLNTGAMADFLFFFFRKSFCLEFESNGS
jgi:hypothetical protein